MEGSLGALAPQAAALLVGGLVTSLGPTFWARGARGQATLLGMGRAPFAAILVGLAVIGVGASIWIAGSVVRAPTAEFAELSHWRLLGLGLAVGLPLGVPGLIAVRSEATRRERESGKRRDRVFTKDDRRKYAADLVRQIADVSPRPRTLDAGIAGDGGTVLRFEGDIDAAEGERLTAALRADLRELGFKRVEGTNGTKEWWSRV